MSVERNSCAGKWKDGKSTMKQEPEERTIKELFQRLKQEDEGRAPSFADSWAAARSRLETRGQFVRARASNWPRWSLAAVAAILIAFGFMVYRVIQNEPQKADSVITEKAPTPKPSVDRKEQVVKEKLGPRRGQRAPSKASQRASAQRPPHYLQHARLRKEGGIRHRFRSTELWRRSEADGKRRGDPPADAALRAHRLRIAGECRTRRRA